MDRQKFKLRFDSTRRAQIIRINTGYVSTTRFPYAIVGSYIRSGRAIAMKQPKPGIFAPSGLDKFDRVIVGIVVHNDVFPV
jgi:hypothetical protein